MHRALPETAGLSASEATLKGAPWWKESRFDEQHHRSIAKLLWYSLTPKRSQFEGHGSCYHGLYFMYQTFTSIARKLRIEWCLYQKDKVNGTNTYKVREELPVNARQLVYPI